MQDVSQSWKDNQNETLVSESYLEVSLDISDPEALVDASAVDSGSIHIANTAQVVSEVDKNIVPYGTLEQNLWVLDGSREVIPETDYGDNGYISDAVCNSSGDFALDTNGSYPHVTINFSKVHTNPIPAITITWSEAYGEYATDFVIHIKKGGEVVVSAPVTGNTSVKSVTMVDFSEYDEIVIDVKKWCLPYRRARIEEIFIGLNKVYDKSDLFSYHHSQTADPVSTALPKAEVSFSVNNIDETYNPNNAKGLSKYLMERQEVKTKYGYKLPDGTVEWIKGGTFYLSEWDAPQNGMSADFTARDLLEYMSGTFYGGVYNADGTSLYDLAVQIMTAADLPLNSDGTVKWFIDDSLKNIYTTAPLPVDTSANCLQLIANAGCCVLTQDRGGTLRMEPIGTETSDYEITHFNSLSKSDITLSKPLKAVSVKAYQYFTGDTSELYNGVLSISGTVEVMITYSGMADNVSATITNGTIVSAEYFTSACKLTITADGDVGVIVTGNTLESSSAEVVVSSGATGETTSVDNPLITSRERAVIVGEWIESYLRNRITLSSSWRADPRLDVLDIVKNQNEYNTNTVRMTSVSYDYNGAFKGSGEGRVI